MKRCAAVMLVFGCLAAASDASAETPPPTVSVEGVASVAISKTASSAEANGAYRQGLVAAIADGLEKAEFLAARTGAKVGAIQQISEDGGSVDCDMRAEVETASEYVPYEGSQPDLGWAQDASRDTVIAPQAATAAPHPLTTSHGKKKKKRKKKKHSAKKASAGSCALSTQILLSYLLS